MLHIKSGKGEMKMKKIMVAIVVLAFWLGAGLCYAESAIPNLIGTWAVKGEGGVIPRSNAAGTKTHHNGDFSSITAEAVVTKQQGRVLHGTFTSPKASESFIAVIGMDNKSLYYADEDGFMEGKIVNKNRLEVIYRHTSPADTVVAVGTWTKKDPALKSR
jgi:hypothetical protein